MDNMINREKRVGAGIITMSVLYFIGQAFTILGVIINLVFKDQINNFLLEAGTAADVNPTELTITLCIAIIIIIAVILILLKKPIGAFIFIGIEILSFVYKAIVAGVTIYTPLSLIFPGLMIFFIYKKKDIYFVKE